MKIIHKLYMIELPFTTKEYEICQLYTAARMSIDESHGDSGVEIVENRDVEHETFGKCRKTLKTMYLHSRVPKVIGKVVPKKWLIVDEIAYNAFPRCHTTYLNRRFGPETFQITIQSDHKDGPVVDENILNIDEEVYKNITKEYIRLDEKILDARYNPKKFTETSERPLYNSPVKMVCYKYVTVKIDYWGLEWTANEFNKYVRDIFLAAHQRMYCTYNEWKNLTIEDIRKLEKEAQLVLDEKKAKFAQ